MSNVLSIYVKPFSSIDLQSSGVYAYSESPDFEILIVAYAFNDAPVKNIDLKSGETLPEELIEALDNIEVTKVCFDSNFVRVCLGKHLNRILSPKSWMCTAVLAASIGLPLDLMTTCKITHINCEKINDEKTLMAYFSMLNSDGIRKTSSENLAKWDLLKKSCLAQVDIERAIRTKVNHFERYEKEQELYELDQTINDRGILVDFKLLQEAIKASANIKASNLSSAQEKTGLLNPNSPKQLTEWLNSKGNDIYFLTNDSIEDLLDSGTEEVKEVLTLKLQLGKTSLKKYDAMAKVLSADQRIRGLLKLYGAIRTGRWSSHLVQIQNLPRNHIKDIDLARDFLKEGHIETLEMLYGDVSNVLSELIRTTFIPATGSRFIISDFSAIEARVLAWVAEEEWVLTSFREGKGIYEATAARMFSVPEASIVKGNINYKYREKGKQAVLACGYQGGVNALKAMSVNLEENEMNSIVTAWRKANPNIVKFWKRIENAAREVIKSNTTMNIGVIKMSMLRNILIITLPSGRSLKYQASKIDSIQKISSMGLEDNKWTRVDTYGGKLTENIVQAIARDILAEAMLQLEKAGYKIVMHVHDEVVIEEVIGKGSIEDVCKIMSQSPVWANKLPLSAEGYESQYYRKEQ